MVPAKYIIPYILVTAFSYYFAKDALGYASPFVFGMFASLAMTVALFAKGKGFRPILNRGTLIFSFFYWMATVTWYVGLIYLSPPQSAILSFTMPLFTIPLAILVLKERGTRIEIGGAVVGFAGIVLFNLPLLNGSTAILGAAITLVDAFSWALFTVYLRTVRGQDIPRTLATSSLICFILYVPLSAFDFRLVPSVGLGLDVVYLGLISGAFNMYVWMAMVKVEKVGRLTTLVFIAPVITLIYSVATTGAIPSYLTMGGVVLIFLGIYSSNILGTRATAKAPEPPSPA